MFRKSLSVLLSLSLVLSPISAYGNMALGIGIGVATDNLALGIAIGAAMEASDSNSASLPAPAVVRMVRVLFNGDRSMTPEDAAIFLKFLAGQTDGIDPERLQQVTDKYDNRRDVKVFLESLYELDHLKMTRSGSRSEFLPFIEAMDEVLKSGEAIEVLKAENANLGIKLEDSAIDNVREIQRGFGLAQLIEDIQAERTTWRLGEFKDGAESWTAREMIDIRFDIKAENNPNIMTEEVADAYRAQFALTVLNSLEQVHGDRLQDNYQRTRDKFVDGSAYDDYIARERDREYQPSDVGIVVALLLAIGGGGIGGIGYMEYLADFSRPMLVDFGGLILSFLLGAGVPFAGVIQLEKYVKKLVHRSKLASVERILRESKPILEGFNAHRFCELVLKNQPETED